MCTVNSSGYIGKPAYVMPLCAIFDPVTVACYFYQNDLLKQAQTEMYSPIITAAMSRTASYGAGQVGKNGFTK